MKRVSAVLSLLFLRCCIVISSAHYRCKIRSRGSSQKSNGRILSAFNDALGSGVACGTYYDPALTYAVNKLHPATLRHPGGNPANYWNFSNASMVSPCSYSTDYNRCGDEQEINKYPAQTFTANNFANGIVKSSPINNHTIVFDLNLLTLSDEKEMLNQINYLKHTNIDVNNNEYLFELGNELYNHHEYNWSNISNGTYYMQHLLPLIAKIRHDFGPYPQSRIAAVSAVGYKSLYTTTSYHNVWDVNVAKYSKYYDGVQIHDYTLNPSIIENLSSSIDQATFISNFGIAIIPQYINYTKRIFGEDIKIWMTEYNWGGSFNKTMQESVIHGMFVLSYIKSSVCNSDMMELLMYHSFASTSTTNYNQIIRPSVTKSLNTSINTTYFSTTAQIYAHFSWIGLVKNNRMHCLIIDNFDDDKCPNARIPILNTNNLPCVYGIGFHNDTDVNMFGFALINSCGNDIDISFNINSITTLTHNVHVDIWTYLANQSNDFVPFSDCNDTQQVWECAPVKPSYKNTQILHTQNAINMTLKALSATFAVVNE